MHSRQTCFSEHCLQIEPRDTFAPVLHIFLILTKNRNKNIMLYKLELLHCMYKKRLPEEITTGGVQMNYKQRREIVSNQHPKDKKVHFHLKPTLAPFLALCSCRQIKNAVEIERSIVIILVLLFQD